MNIFAGVDTSIIDNLALAFSIIVAVDVISALLLGKLLQFIRIPKNFIVKIVSVYSILALLYLVVIFEKYLPQEVERRFETTERTLLFWGLFLKTCKLYLSPSKKLKSW
ncbi:hypothetical protein P9265_01740 [Schinkia azotoformans]|uniref:hypothetical protein n=1 Tax=Schinkia azotoformans TaxID=1454 RepID=UPI002E1EA3D1|nr:hypothetical protein [Schinkia azotoformans]